MARKEERILTTHERQILRLRREAQLCFEQARDANRRKDEVFSKLAATECPFRIGNIVMETNSYISGSDIFLIDGIVPDFFMVNMREGKIDFDRLSTWKIRGFKLTPTGKLNNRYKNACVSHSRDFIVVGEGDPVAKTVITFNKDLVAAQLEKRAQKQADYIKRIELD